MTTEVAHALVYQFDLEAYMSVCAKTCISKLSKNVLCDVITENLNLWEKNLGFYFTVVLKHLVLPLQIQKVLCNSSMCETWKSAFWFVVFLSALFATAVAEHILELYRGRVGAPQTYSSFCYSNLWHLHVFTCFIHK